MTIERSLVIVKPDGVRRGQIGEVIRRIETKGYLIDALRMLAATDDQLREHYAEHEAKPFFLDLLEYMTDGPVVAMVIEGSGCIDGFRAMAGATNPTAAVPGSIRGDLGRDWGSGRIENVVHGSDSVASAEREIPIWFPELDS
ncbi:MAG TPA: nucleoside-diphosphate kinase [Actinomycetaceae bacterium]|nr:nucleoside-diphosphate kinase [Actinomycetaceae bacterium]